MKINYLKYLLVLTLVFPALVSKAQQNDDLLNVLVKKNVISEQEADSLRSDAAIKAQKKKDADVANQHSITIGTRALQLSGLVQTEYEGFEQSTKSNTFLLHRARLDVKGSISDDWSYEVYTEFSGVNPKLLDAYTTYKIADYLKITAGQFKVPFSYESLQSDADLEFIDRSQVVNALAARSTDVIGNQNGRDIGGELTGSFAKLNDHYLFDYYFAVLNGAGYDVTTDNNNHKDIAGRLAIHPIQNLTLAADFYHGIDLFTVAAGTAKVNTLNLRNRQGIDAHYVWQKLSLTAEYDKGTDAHINRNGWYGQAAYFVWSNKLQLAARYDTFDPTQTITTDRTTNYAGGVNYFFNKWAKFTVDYIDVREQAATQIKNNLFEAQLQLVF
jgi:phosphate-selective porin OprO and OprP